MINEVITSILDAEKEAERIAKEANVSARERIAGADEKAKTVLDEARTFAKNERLSLTETATKKADEDYALSIKNAEQNALAIKERAKGNVQKAVDFIVEEII